MVQLSKLVLSSTLLFQYAVGASPEIVQNLYQILPNYKFKSIGIKQELDEHIKTLQDYLYHWKPPGELNIEFFEIYSKPVTYGNYISPLDCLKPPTEIQFVSFFPLSVNFYKEKYTLVLNGIDKDGFETCHAVWVNLLFNDENYEIVGHEDGKESFKVKFNLRYSDDLMKYIGPRPKEDTGIHKYVFILFRQPYGHFPPHKLKFRENWGSMHPSHHGVASWANYYALQPIGINFFTSSNENLF